MSELDRGAYTPQTDEPLAFDARRARGGGGGGGPAPLTLLVSAIILMAMIVGLLVFYRHGVRHAGQAPQVIGAPVAQTKSAPSAEAASSDQAAGLQVYKSEVTPPSESRSPSFEAAPEQPAPLPAARPVAPPPAVISAEPLRGVASTPAPAAARPAAPKPAAPKPVVVAAAKPALATPAAPPTEDSNLAASAFSGHAAPPPHVQSAATHPAASSSKPLAVATATPKPASSAKPKAKPVEAAPAPAPEAASGGAMVQIGAFSSSALAQKGWSDTAHLLPGPMAGKSRKVEVTTKDGKTFYRAYVGGFASREAASNFCAALKAKNKPCFVK